MQEFRHKQPRRNGPIKVLMQNRRNVFTQRGGDSVLMERLIAGLESLGVQVTVDLDGQHNLKDFDLVHLVNFALPDMVRYFGEQAVQAGVPFVVTTLAEDIPQFHNQSVAVGRKLIEYARAGQPQTSYRNYRVEISSIERCTRFDNSWVAGQAAALFSNGKQESDVLRRDYPQAKNIVEIPLGYEVGTANPENFIREFGVSDFILCVGRFETRKNQLMLLKALENCEIPVVLAGGGFSYQPDYDAAVRGFQRKGRTIILPKIDAGMLASAYAAAKVHALPSWYELPGLVSLEAAALGCNVVVTRYGTAKDYFGDLAYYCEPDNDESVFQAVMTAYYTPVKPELQEVVMKYTWNETARQTLAQYEQVTGISQQQEPPMVKTIDVGMFDMAPAVSEFQEVLEQGELAARNRDYNLAHEFLTRAQQMNPASVRALRARGAVFIAENSTERAAECFEKALLIDSTDAKTLSGLGMCAMNRQDAKEAYQYFVRALRSDPYQLVAILQLVECAYVLNSFEDLQRVLESYIAKNIEDVDMRYCLAGCYFKMGRINDARHVAESILSKNPEHLGSRQLLDAILDGESQAAKPVAASTAAAPVSQEIPATPAPFRTSDPVDQKLDELELAKKSKQYTQVVTESSMLLQRSDLTDQQRERARIFRAEGAVLTGDIATAEPLYLEILAENPRSARAICGQGAISAAYGNLAAAQSSFEQGLAIDPDYDVALAGMGLISQWQGAPDRAWDYFQQALHANPENSRALYGLMEVGYRLRRLQDVESALRGYLEFHPADLDFLYALAGCCFAQDKLREATEELEKISIFNPGHERAAELNQLIAQKQSGSDAAVPQQMAAMPR